jgi:riboflavin synthase
MRYVVPKGSITVDGVSLTVVDVAADGFTVALIPHTQEATLLCRHPLGWPVNLEADVLAKYVERAAVYISAAPVVPAVPAEPVGPAEPAVPEGPAALPESGTPGREG